MPTLTIERLAAAPWAIDRAVLAELVTGAERGTFAAVPRPPAEARTQGVVAVLPIHGAIERRSTWLGELLGSASIEAMRASLRAAIADPDVRGVILSVDSPGGTVAGVTELAAEIRELRRVKPIVAFVDTTAASAAYWLASQASEVVVTPSGSVGSIGVFAVHQDISGALEQEGVKVTIISAGEYKVEGNEFEPLTDEAKAAMQARADAFYDQFVGDVAKGRGVTASVVKEDYGKGRMLLPSDALAAGMVDAIDTLDGALRRVARLSRSTGMAAEAGAPEIEAEEEPLPLRSRLTDLVADATSITHHIAVRAELRAKEGRRPISGPIEADLRAIRGLVDSLLPADPAAVPPPAVDPPPVVPVAQPVAAAPVTPRFRSQDEWIAFLETH